MCIVALNYNPSSDNPLQIIANRDEFYDRPAQPLHEWLLNGVKIYGGRDEKEQGTWLATNSKGYLVVITNYRNPRLEKSTAQSRGQIATQFLIGHHTSLAFARELQLDKDNYGPFNVLLFDGEQLVHYNNVTNVITKVTTGIHGLCNATLNTPWPKVEKLKKQYTKAIANHDSDEQLFTILRDETKAPVSMLPSTGVAPELELGLSSIFIRLPHYGTRCSTICTISNTTISMQEWTYVQGEPTHFEQLIRPIET